MTGSRSDYDLMQIHVRALYLHDDQSRMVSVNDWHGGVAPRFFLGRTKHGCVWRFRQDLPDAVCETLLEFCKSEMSSLSEKPEFESDYLRILSDHAQIESKWIGPAFWFPNDCENSLGTVSIDASNSSLLSRTMPDWLPDVPHQQPFIVQVVAGEAAAVCASVRITAAAHEAGVETLEIHRRNGYAASVVSSWAKVVKETNAIPLYSTSFNNVGSRNVAARLGLSMYGVDFHVT